MNRYAPRIGTRLALLLALLVGALWVLFSVNRIPTAPGAGALMMPVDSIVLVTPAYVVSLPREGALFVRFPLNEEQRSREEIAAFWRDYPEDSVWEHAPPAEMVGDIFELARSRSVNAARREYVAEVASDLAGPPVMTYTLTTYGGEQPLKQVKLDESRRADWPPGVSALVSALQGAAGRPLPEAKD
jgi:hypothetical protein